MNDESQVRVPDAFLALHRMPGRQQPLVSRTHILARHEFCEDLAQLLTASARARRYDWGITEWDVLQRMHRGLVAEGSPVSPGEAGWVVGRLAELLEWPWTGPTP